MKIPDNRWNHLLASVIVVIFLVCGFTDSSRGTSKGGHDETAAKGWMATDTYRVMNFAVLVVGLFILLRKPASQVLRSRIDGIRDQLSDLEAKKKEAEKLLAEYDERLMALDQEAGEIIAGYVKQGEEAQARIIQAAEAAAEKIEEQARRNIEHEFKLAKLKLQEEVFEKAIVKAEEKIRGKITSKVQEKLVDEYLSKVVV